MATSDRSTPSTAPSGATVACDICLKEVPVSEATVAEATEYFVHFCGLDCYEQWKKRQQAPQESGESPKA